MAEHLLYVGATVFWAPAFAGVTGLGFAFSCVISANAETQKTT